MIRPATADDLPFVRSGWLRSFASSDWATIVSPGEAHTVECRTCGKRSLKATRSSGGLTLRKPSETYWTGQRELIERLLRRSLVLVAQGEHDELLDGFMVCELPDVLHYVYVRSICRQRGVARELVAVLQGPVRYTHRARAIEEARIPRGWLYDPYQLTVAA